MTTLFLFAAVQGAGLKRRAPLPGDDEEDWDEEDDEWQEDDEWREEGEEYADEEYEEEYDTGEPDGEWYEDEYEEEEVNEWEDEDETSYRGQSHGGKRRSGRKGW